MPVTAFGSKPVAAPPPAPAAAPPAPATASAPAAAAAAGAGHGVTRLVQHGPVYGDRARAFPGAPPPRGETAGAHGAHKGRISVR